MRHHGPVRLRIVAFNDFHGNLRPPQGGVKTPDGEVPAGGASHFAAHVAQLRRGREHAVLVSAGDLIGGTPLISALLHDEPTIQVMDLIGLDINGIGNHELDEGSEELLRMKNGGCHPKDGCQAGEFDGANFSFLAANVARREGGTLFPPYEIRSFSGVPVAFVGMTLEATPAFVPPVIPDLTFQDEADTVQRLMPELKAKGVEAVVVLLHEGGLPEGGYDECIGMSGPILDVVARMPPEVDVVVTGHTHQAYNCRMHGKVVTSAGSFGRLLTTIDLELDPSTRDVSAAVAKNHVVDHGVPEDERVVELVRRYEQVTLPLENRPIGEVTAPLRREQSESGESPLGGVIADAQLAATDAQIAFMNSGGIRADLGAEDRRITYGMAFTTQPFGNTLVTMTLTGRQLHQLLEDQWTGDRVRFLQVSRSLSYVWHADREDGDRIDPEDVTIDGKPLDLDAEYRVVVNNFLAERGVLKQGRNRRTGIVDVDALEAYLGAHSPVSPPSQGRIRRGP